MHNDARGTINSLQQGSVMPNDNICLLTTIFVLAQHILCQGRHVILNWIPRHIGIRGNEFGDQLVQHCKEKSSDDMVIKLSWALLRCRAEEAGHAGVQQLHREEARTSSSARWYGDAAGHEHLMMSGLKSRGSEVIMHRLKLGYSCAWQNMIPYSEAIVVANIVVRQRSDCSSIFWSVNTHASSSEAPEYWCWADKTVTPEHEPLGTESLEAFRPPHKDSVMMIKWDLLVRVKVRSELNWRIQDIHTYETEKVDHSIVIVHFIVWPMPSPWNVEYFITRGSWEVVNCQVNCWFTIIIIIIIIAIVINITNLNVIIIINFIYILYYISSMFWYYGYDDHYHCHHCCCY